MAIQDVQVTIDVQNPAPKIGLGRPLILAASTETESIYKEYSELDTLKQDFPESTSVYKKAAAVFAQTNRPDIVAVATYSASGGGEPGTGLTIVQALEKYFDRSWHFLLLPDAISSERLAVSNALQARKFKFLVLKIEDKAEIDQYKLNSRTILYYHPDKPDEEIDAAIVGDAASLTVGSITWKFRKNLSGVTPIDISAGELKSLHSSGANAYVLKAGTPQTSEGLTASGSYIDFIHGQDWVKANIESGLQQMLSDNDKVPSNDTGIAMAVSVVTTVLSVAAQNGIIDKDENGNAEFTVFSKTMNEIPAEDREKRIYSGLSFEYYPEGAFHEMKVKGTVVNY
ncbi:DUF3383 family protein [Aeribacillus sp. FSL M8-0235]|uniref:DUF3383 family protein n=1 Tax=Aeribacillus sp. FSL M8-0235 TaxID=2954576 RepID=UPI0030F7E95F